MPQYKNPKSGDLFELPTKFGSDGKTDVNREKAIAKGYQPVEASAPIADDTEEVTNPKTNQKYKIPKSEVSKAIAKGYVATNSPTPATEKDSDPSFAEETWDKVKSIPGNAVDAVKDAARLGVRVVTGRTEEGEIADRLGNAARGAGDVIQVIGDAPARAVAAVPNLVSYLTTGNTLYKGVGEKETARVLDSTGLADKESLEAKDEKYPGARSAGQMIPALVLPSNSIPAVVASGAGYAAATQIADTGKIDPRELASDTIAGMAPLGVMKGASKALEVGGKVAQKVGRAATDKYGEKIAAKYPKAEQFLDDADLIDEASKGDKTAQDLSEQKSQTTQDTKDRYEGLKLENKTQTSYIDDQADVVKKAQEKATKDIDTRYDGLKIDESAQLGKLDRRIGEIKANKREGDFTRETELDKLDATTAKLDADIAEKASAGIDERRKETNSAYAELNRGIKEALAFAPDINNQLKSRMQTMQQKLASDPAITSAHKGKIDKLVNEIYKKNLPEIEQNLEISKVIKEFVRDAKPLDSVENNSIYALGEYSYNLTNEINDLLRDTSPELAKLEMNARATAKSEIVNRDYVKKKLGSTQRSGKKELDSAKIKSRLKNAGALENKELRESLEFEGAKPELTARDRATQRMDALRGEEALAKRWTDKGVSNLQESKAQRTTEFNPQRDSEVYDVDKKYNPVRERLMSRKSEIEYPELNGQLQSEIRDINTEFDPRIQRERDLNQDYKDLQRSEGWVKQGIGAGVGGVIGGATGSIFGPVAATTGGLAGAEWGRRAGKNLATGMGQVKLYNSLSKTFNKPALTSMVKVLAESGRPLSLAAIAGLASQHNVDGEKLTKLLVEEGVNVVPND